MGLEVAVQMDHISCIDINGDSTFALMLEAQRRGHTLFHYEVDSLSMREGHVYAFCEIIEVKDKKGAHYSLRDAQLRDLAKMDVILMRQDPPFDMGYITATHLLERIHPGTLVVNNPGEVRNAPEKIFVTEFNELMPETLITRSADEVKRFRDEFKDIIIKPLYSSGGEGVFRISEENENLFSLIRMFYDRWREPFIVQRYLKEIKEGDKRIILIDGTPVGAINRLPMQGEARSNMHVGGKAEIVSMTEKEQEICARIGPELKRRGFIFVGIDVIGGYLTEINVTSPTGIREVKRFGGADISELFWSVLEGKRS
ncbi:glutathione synthase [Candidatus Endowatersipora endosymbiont of Watersipora subatra]|uniref:glutathione synthase n=1 Tax=Candidatus Endowatersipora endosymbiont of Watersipora subatra TaxID=3077946 RepID=UPI00312C9D18